MSEVDNESDVVGHRRRKLAALRDVGDAYPNAFRREDTAADLHVRHGNAEKDALEASSVRAVVAGRVMLRRVMGKASFLTLEDPSGRIQCYLRRDEVGSETYQEFKDLWDIGDIVGVEGTLMKTNKGELTVQASAGSPAGQVAQALAGEVPRLGRPGDALPPALPRPHGQRGVARGVPGARAAGCRDAPLLRRARLSRSRNAHDASHSGGCHRAALRHAPHTPPPPPPPPPPHPPPPPPPPSAWTCTCASRPSCTSSAS